MKIIIIKEYKTWKINDIVETSDGFAKNFLIKNKYAHAYNKKNNSNLNMRLSKIKKDQETENALLTTIKIQIEKLVLNFKLKVSGKNIIGSISTKNVIKNLSELNIKVPKHSIQNIHIKSLGISNITINLNKYICASLKIEVVGDYV